MEAGASADPTRSGYRRAIKKGGKAPCRESLYSHHGCYASQSRDKTGARQQYLPDGERP